MFNFLRKNIKKVIIFSITFLFLFGLFNIFFAQAAIINNRKVDLTDSRPSQISTYDFEGDLSGSSIQCIQVDFCTSAVGGCTGPTDLDTSTGSKGVESLWNGFSDYVSWDYTSVDDNTFRFVYNAFFPLSQEPAADASWAVSNITNSSLAGSYYAWVNTYSDSGCSTGVDSGAVAFANVAGVGVSVVIGESSTPTISSIDPSSKYVNDPGFTMTVNGTNFVNGGSTVRFAGSDRSTTYISDTQLTVEILASDLETVGGYNITVFNTGTGESNPVVFSVNSRGGGGGNPVPHLLTINPSSKNKGDPEFIMTLTGYDFISSSVVRFEGSDRSTTYINSTTLQATILVTDLETAGEFDINVFTPTPDGGTSETKIFTVIDIGEENPIPTLDLIDPNSKIVGDPTFTMILTGSNFISSSVVRFVGSDRITTYINSTTLQAQIPSSDLQTTGDYNITVFNPTPGGGESGVKVFSVLNPDPILNTINPIWKYINSDAFTMILTGSNFVSDSVMKFDGSDRVTTYINSTTLEAQVLASDLDADGFFNITIFNPLPGGGESAAQIFRVLKISDNPIPTLFAIDPSWKYVNSPAFTMILTGSDFIESSIVRFAGAERTTTFVNSNKLEAFILYSDLQTADDYNVTVFNPMPGGGESLPQIFQVIAFSENPPPTLDLISPSWRYRNSSAFTMTLTGSNFISSSVVRFVGSDRITTYINSTTLQAQIPSSDLQTTGDYNITVFNPTPGGGESGVKVFSVLLQEGEEEVETPTILEPLDGTITNQKIINIKGKAGANQLIDIFANDQKIKSVYTDGDGVFETGLELEEGEYFIYVSSQGKQSNGINLIVDRTPPESPVLLEATVVSQRLLIGQISFSLFVRGQNSADSVTIRAVIGPEFIFSPDNQQWERTFDLILPAGRHQIYAFAYDLAGNISLPSNVLDFNIGLEVEPPLNILPPMIIVPEIIQEIIDNPMVEKITEDTSEIAIPIATALAIGATVSAIASSGIGLIQLLPALYFLFIQPLVYIFSKKRKRGWGIVYNSLTKQPVDLAVIRLFDAKTYRLLATKVSDKEGRYIFVVDPGIYRMTISKQEYVFPSKILAQFKEDSRYLNLYHGQPIEVKEKNTVINANIPLDPNKKFRSDHWLIRDNMTFSLKLAVPIAAFALSFLSYIINPNIYILFLFIFNFLLFILVRSIKPKIKKDWGIVYDKQDKNPLNLTVVRIFDSTFDKLLDQQVTNRKGQYGFLVGGRKFYLTYNKNGYVEKVSDPLDFTKQEKGKIVGFDAYLEKIKEEQQQKLTENKQDFIEKLDQEEKAEVEDKVKNKEE